MEKLYLDLDNYRLVVSATNQSALPRIVFSESDKFLLSIVLLRENPNDNGDAPYLIQTDFPSPYDMIHLGCREVGNLEPDINLLSHGTFAIVGTGDDTVFQAEVDLDTDAMRTAVDGKASINLVIDFELSNVGYTRRYTFAKQVTTILYRDIYRDSEPTDASLLAATDNLNRSLVYREVPLTVTLTIPDKCAWVVPDPIITGDVVLEGDGQIFVL